MAEHVIRVRNEARWVDICTCITAMNYWKNSLPIREAVTAAVTAQQYTLRVWVGGCGWLCVCVCVYVGWLIKAHIRCRLCFVM